jgi:hypothetical protein
MTIWQPSGDRLWEFFQARKGRDGWHAAWGGAISHVSRSPGYYTSTSWPGSHPNWGVTSASLPVAAGLMTAAELRSGRIRHALSVSLPSPRAGVFSWPAQRTDGTGTAATDLPEGAHLRIDPRVDLDRISMPPMTRMMAAAAQRYGIIVNSQTHHAIGFAAEDPASVGREPYYGPEGLFGGKWPGELLASFPWERLQVLKMQLHAQR